MTATSTEITSPNRSVLDPTTSLTATASTRRVLPSRAAFALLTSILVTLLASSSAPTPLYATYQARWGFSPVTITVIFGVYAIAVLASLLVAGSLSDHIGRRPVLIGALCAQAIVMLLFAFAGGVDVLLVARVLQGLATGAAVGAIGAGLVDLHPGRGAVANAAGAMSGTASGALVSALLVQLLPVPTKLVYLLLLALFLLQALGVWAIAETSPRAPGIRHALRPTIALPPRVREVLLIAAPSLIAVWALAGFYGSLGPSLAAQVGRSGSTILGGAALFALAASGALTVLLFHRTEPRRFALAGNALVILGVAIVLWSVTTTSIVGFFAGTILAGAGFGAGFQGGLRTIVALAGPTERAGVISVAYIICYLAMGLPAILAGVLVVDSTVTRTAEEFGITVIALSALTALGTILSARRAERQRRLSPCQIDQGVQHVA
jgi:predicted MFS family arabinose efflux permease